MALVHRARVMARGVGLDIATLGGHVRGVVFEHGFAVILDWDFRRRWGSATSCPVVSASGVLDES